MENSNQLSLDTRKEIAAGAVQTTLDLFRDGRINDEQAHQSVIKIYDSLGLTLDGEEIIK